MALSSNLVWEVRPTAGSDNNGGGFGPGGGGTDWSQQNSPQYAITTATTAAANAIILSALAATDMVGNVCQIISGTNFITGFYKIISISAGVSFTLDRTCTSAAGASGVINIGGALATIAAAVAPAVSNNIIYIKATGTYTVTTSLVLTGANSVTGTPFSFIGYTTTRGDNGQVTWTTATNSIDLVQFNSSAYGYLFQNIKFTNTAGTRADGLSAKSSNAYGIQVDNCVFDGCQIGIDGNFASIFEFASLLVTNTEIKNSVSHGVFNSGETHIHGCYIHANGGDGIRISNSAATVNSGTLTVENSIIKSNTGLGINNISTQIPNVVGYRYAIIKSCAIINNTSDGIAFGTGGNSVTGLLLWNCIIDNNGGFGINFQTSQSAGFSDVRNNAFKSNTSGNRSNFAFGSASDVTLTAECFTNRGSADFSLNSTAGGGAACKGAGYPGVLTIGGTGFVDIGPLQSSGGGASTTIVVSPNVINYLVDQGV